MSSTPSHLDAGGKPLPKQVGGFQILDWVGEGGMGTVYRAKQTSLDRLVALKVLAPHLAANEGYIDSFIREARAAARLNHPNIIPVFDAGKADMVYYYAMEFVEGETLYKWVNREGSLPEKMVLEIGLCVANALRHAWERERLIHRDVKPENVMIDLRGNVKLCDLGLAKYFGEDTLMSLSGQAFGTPNYMAPEQALAERTIDCRADIYGLGMTIYYALTAQIPFHGGSAAMVMARHLTEQLPDPREFSPDIRPHTCQLLQRMLAKNASDRYQSWDDVIGEFERLRADNKPMTPPLPARKSSLRLREHGGSGVSDNAAAAGTPPPRQRSALALVAAGLAALIALSLVAGSASWVVARLRPPSGATNNSGPPALPVKNPAAEKLAAIKNFIAANPAALDQIIGQLKQFDTEFPNAAENAEARKLLAEAEAKRCGAAPKRARPESIEAGLQFLASQQKQNGSFGAKQVGVDALALRAFLVNGHLPGRDGPYRAVVENALAYVMSQQTPDGQFTGGGGRMYGHGITTLMLAELYAATRDEKLKTPLTKALRIILDAQRIAKSPQHQGGWRYETTSRDSDLSVTGWQLAALIKGKEIGFVIPEATIEDAIAYILRCSHPNGGFGYNKPDQAPSTTAVGMAMLLRAGERESPELWKAAGYFLKDPWNKNLWAYYTIYYGTLAMYQFGGKNWEMWRDTMDKMLPPLQQPDGSFQLGSGTESGQGGIIYTTSLMVLTQSIIENKFPDLKLGTGEAPPALVSRSTRKHKELVEFAASNPGTEALKDKYAAFLRAFPNGPEAQAVRAALQAITTRESQEKAKAQQAYNEFTKQFLAALATRRYDEALRLAEQARVNPALAPELQRVTVMRDVAARLQAFWTTFPRDLSRLVGKTVTVQNTTGKVAEIARDEIVLEIAANAMVGFSISQLTTAEVVTLGTAAGGDDEAARLLDLAWFCFAEANLKLCDQLLDLAQRKGADAAAARATMASLSAASVEFEAEKIYNEILALIAAKRWTEAREKVALFKQRFTNTKAFAAAQANLAQWDLTLAIEEAAAKTASNLLHTLSGHDNAVSSVAVSPDGRTVLTGSHDKSVRLWDMVTGRELRTLGHHGDGVRGVAFTPDGRAAVSVGHDTTVRVWSVTGGELRSKRFNMRSLLCVAVSPDGKLAAAGEDSATVRLVDIASGESPRSFNTGGSAIVSLDFSPDGKYLIVGVEVGSLHLWDTATWKETRSFRTFGGAAFAVFSPDSRFILGGGIGGKMFALWETASGKEVRQFHGHTDNVRCVAFRRDGKWILSGGNDRTVRLWDAATGRELKKFEGHTGAIRSVAFSADGKFGVSASDDRTVKIWKLESDGAAAQQGSSVVATWKGHEAPVNCLTLSPDGRTVISGSYDKMLRLWDVATGRELRQFRGPGDGIRGVTFSGDGRLIASASEDKTVRLWDAASGQEIRSIKAGDH